MPADERIPTPPWFRQHFNEDYRTIYAGRSQAEADREVELVVDRLRPTSEETTLDLCCGFGRHLHAFAERGLRAIGLDLSAALLAHAPRGTGLALVCADMRRLPFADRSFPVLVNFFTSFGYFDRDEENLAALREIHRVLAPAGRFCLDLMNPAHVLETLVPESERRAGPFELHEERWFDATRRRVEKRIRLQDTRDGSRKEYLESVRVYEEDEARSLLVEAGLVPREVLGDFAGGPATPSSPRLVFLGVRP